MLLRIEKRRSKTIEKWSNDTDNSQEKKGSGPNTYEKMANMVHNMRNTN